MGLYDIAVIGAGPAGLAVAITAAARGARVALIEAAEDIGGALHLSAGSFSCAGHPMQAGMGIADTPQSHYEDCQRISHGTGDARKLRLWVDHAADTLEWLFERGLEMGPDMPEMNHAHEPYSVPRIYTPPEGGLSYLKALRAAITPAIAAGQVELMLSARAVRLVCDDDGAVRGVDFEREGAVGTVSARKLVLACGGYAHSARHWVELHGLPGRNHSYPYSRGDGIELARGIGGVVAHVEDYLPTIGGTIDIDQPESCWINTRISPVTRMPWEIFVNLHGRRFMAEDRPGRDWRERVVANQPEGAFWVIYDEAIRRQAPPFLLMSQDKADRAFRDHPDYVRADNVAALAARTGLPRATLDATIARYNAGIAVGSDEMGREHCPLPIGKGPLYAVKHHSTAVVSFGGILTGDAFEVLRSDGSPIPNLFAVGEVLGQGVLGNAFLGGSMVASSITHGRILGEALLDR